MGERGTSSIEVNRADGLVNGGIDEKNLSLEYKKYHVTIRWMVDKLKTIAQSDVQFFRSKTIKLLSSSK